MERPSHFRGRPVSGLEAAHANEYFEPFLNATTLKNILGYYRSMCEFLHLKPNVFTQFYPKLRANLTTWRAKALWKKFDARASHKCYGKGKICANTRVLVIGGGPCGLRTAIEAQLLGAKVVVVEKRDRLSRNNVLHLWPFVIEDLRMLGAKKFFGKFCAGAIDHISIRQLQCILLKVALLLGVEIHTEVSFEQLVEPSLTEKTGWRASVKPDNHPVSQYEFDVIIGADGKRNTLQGFKRKEFRGKLAIAITANFINKKTEAEARVEEISGVAFIFNQKFFKDLQAETRIDLENIVYYKDDTHYFVMTAKKASLLEKGVILQDLADTEKLLAPDNVDREALQNYAREAADFSTNYLMPDLEFAVNHYGQPDVAMFDFTSMYAAEYASKVVEKNGSKVLKILVGDSLLEPFWPTGSGCARGFLSSLDAAWAIRSWSLGTLTPLDVLAERESIYRLLAQTTPDNLNKDWKSYTLDPATRYPNLNKTVVLPHQTICLYETDNPNSIEKMKRTSHEMVRQEGPKKRRRGNVDNEVLLTWLAEQLREHDDIKISDISSIFRDGRILCAIIHHYRPDLLDYTSVQDENPMLRNQLAVDILEKDLGVPPIMTGDELTHTEDYLVMASYLTQVYDTFRGEIPHIKHPKLSVRKKPLTKPLEILSISPPVTPFFLENRKIKLTSITNIKETHGINTLTKFDSKCNSDETMRNKKNVFRIKVKRRRGEQVSLADIQKCFSENFFNKGYHTKTNSNEYDLFDLTYGDEMINTSSCEKIKFSFGNQRNICGRGDGKCIVGHCSDTVEGSKLKDSLRFPTTKQVLKSKTSLKKKRVELKKSNLSVIPENGDEKLNDKSSKPVDIPVFSEKSPHLNSQPIEQKLIEEENVKNTSTKSIQNREPSLDSDYDIQQLELPRIPSPMRSTISFAIENKRDMSKQELIKKISSHIVVKTADIQEKAFRKLFRVKQKLKKYLDRSLNNLLMSNYMGTDKNEPAVDLLSKLSSKKSKRNNKQSSLKNSECPKKIPDTNSILPAQIVDSKQQPNSKPKDLPLSSENYPTVTNQTSTGDEKLFVETKISQPCLLMSLDDLVPEVIYRTKSKTSVQRKTFPTAQSSIQEIFPKNINIKQKVSYRTLAKSSFTKVASKNSSGASLEIRVIEKSRDNTVTCQKIQFKSSMNLLTISSKTCLSKPTVIPNRKSCCGGSCRCRSFLNSFNSRNQSTAASETVRYKSYGTKPAVAKSHFRKNTCTHDSKIPVNLTKRDVEIISQLGSQTSCQSHLACHANHKKGHFQKFPSKNKMSASEVDCLPHEIYSRVSNWISSHDFEALDDDPKKDFEGETILTNDISTDITSVTRAMARHKQKGEYDDIKIEERTDVIRCETSSSGLHMSDLLRNVKDSPVVKSSSKFTHYTPFNTSTFRSTSAPPATFSIIVEGEESELPESNKRSEFSFKTIKSSNHNIQPPTVPTVQPPRPTSRHKRHADAITQKPGSIDRKTRKRRTLEKVGPNGEERQKVLEEISANRSERQSKRREQRKRQTEQFLKSMQMLQANAKPDNSQPFEDYSIFLYRQTAPKFEDRVKDLEKQFTYVPDHENKLPSFTRFAEKADEDIASKIKSLENRWTNPQPIEKKPKDLFRAIGKIETSDWNIKQIEKKIMENKLGKPSTNKDKEKVPKWSKEEFMAKLTKMEKKHLDRQDSSEAKFADIDRNIKDLELKLKEGTTRELGKNKVASITEKLVNKVTKEEAKPVEKSVERPPVNLPLQSASEFCHFCGKKVYLMEKVSAEGRFFHRGCFKCQYCHTQLRLGSYSFDRDGQFGHKFFCLHHYGMPGELPRPTAKVTRKSSQRASKNVKSPSKKPFSIVPGLDLVDRVQTPERVEFSNPSPGNISSDHEEPFSQMDEDEWTDKNFGASCAEELDDSDEDSSSVSDTDSDDEGAFDDALEEPVTKEGTMKWAERWKNSFSRKGRHSDSDGYSSSDQSSYYENSSDDDDTDTATEGEEEIRARELRKQEFRVEPPVVQTDTGTDTEIVSDETTSESSSEILNSATEISTDSEFAQDDPTPTREVPAIVFNDFYVTKTRGSSNLYPKKIQVKSGYIQRPLNDKKAPNNPDIQLKLKPLVPPSAPVAKKPAPNFLPRTEGYALNRTQSTGGIAAKVSLELKKKYLLGEQAPGNIQKSGSASTLETKFKSFQSTISDCQKLLKPAPEISASMQVFCDKLNERRSPVLSPQSSQILVDENEKIDQNDLPPPDITITTIKDSNEPTAKIEKEEEHRPRSPVHETSITVPSIDWSKKNESNSSDSLSLTSSSENEAQNSSNFNFDNIPRVEVHTVNEAEVNEEIPPDSLCMEAIEFSAPQVQSISEIPKSVSSLSNEILSKSITSEKKTLNQPKSLPDLEKNLPPEIHKALHVKIKEEPEDSSENEIRSLKAPSDRSSPEVTAALTETELSDWARDGNVSDDIEFDFSHSSDIKPKKVAKLAEVDELSTKECKEVKNRSILTAEAMSSALSANLDNIEFMDTGTETSSDDGIVDSQNGYILFQDEEELALDSLDPNINEVLETRNIYITGELSKNTGFCTLANEESSHRFGSEVFDLKPADLEMMKQKHTAEHDEDSLLILDTGTTTEENTCSDSTVKNVTELTTENRKKEQLILENLQKQRLEDKLAEVKAEQLLLKQQKAEEQKIKEEAAKQAQEETVKFEAHCQRLQSKVGIGNAKDSIDIRKSRRKSKSDISQKPDLIQEEKEHPSSPQHGLVLKLSPDIVNKKENIKKERDVNQKLIQEMVMNKMKAENKSLERKKRNRTSASNLSPNRPYELNRSLTADIVSQININNIGGSSSPRGDKCSTRNSIYSTGSNSTYVTPDLLSDSIPQQKSYSVTAVPDMNSSSSTPLKSEIITNTRPLSVFSSFPTSPNKLPETPLTHPDNFSLPDIRKNLFSEEFKTPKAPPRLNRGGGELAKTAEKLRENARVRARLLSNEDLGLSPEDKLVKLRQKASKRGKENEIIDPHIQESIESLVINTERRNSQLYSNDTLTKKRNNLFRRSKSGDSDVSSVKLTTFNYDDLNRTKSVSEIPKQLATTEIVVEKSGTKKVCKSDPNLLDTDYPDKPKKKTKDRERRKSITKLIANIFKKSPGSGEKGKGLFARLSPKSKAVLIEEPVRRKSLSELNLERRNITPPPVPPLPTNYTNKATDESSEGEADWKRQSSCDTVDQLDQSGVSTSSLNSRRTSKVRKASRQAQLKRHRMAQEIQRKLEETEVKTRELEQRGVSVEKALRGETSDDAEGTGAKDEADLLQEWFDLMRDRTELRRYEKELTVRAKELELEDRHARLQHELRERLESNEPRTEENLIAEEKIIDEMMGIVAKRDSLIAVLEEDRLRYSNEDRDLEEQMLAKGLRLTPIRKSPDK